MDGEFGHGGAGPVRHGIATEHGGGNPGHDQSGVRGVGSFHIPNYDSQGTSTTAGNSDGDRTELPVEAGLLERLSILRWAAGTVTPMPSRAANRLRVRLITGIRGVFTYGAQFLGTCQ